MKIFLCVVIALTFFPLTVVGFLARIGYLLFNDGVNWADDFRNWVLEG